MDTEDVVNIYNGMLLSQENNEIMSLHQHGCNQRLSFGVKRVRKRQISYGITYTWNLKHDTVKLSMKQKQTHRESRLVVAKGDGLAEEWSGRLGLDVSFYIETR